MTGLLLEWSRGDEDALARLMPLVYDQLRGLAAQYLRRERQGHTLQPTALVHEAYLKLVDQRRVRWQSRAHFFGVAARLMRRVLVDHARSRIAAKRGGGHTVSLEVALEPAAPQVVDVVALDELLGRLAALDERQARLVELRFFGGLNVDEIAEVLGVSTPTVKRDWRTARAWLYREMRGGG